MKNYVFSDNREKQKLTEELQKIKNQETASNADLPKYFQLFILTLRAEYKYINWTFFTEYSRFIQNPKTPDLPVFDLKILYKKWTRDPHIMDELIYFAESLPVRTNLAAVWSTIIKNIQKNPWHAKNQVASEYLAYLLPASIFKNDYSAFLDLLISHIYRSTDFLHLVDIKKDKIRSQIRKDYKVTRKIFNSGFKEYAKSKNTISADEFKEFFKFFHFNEIINFNWDGINPEMLIFIESLLQSFSAKHVVEFVFWQPKISNNLFQFTFYRPSNLFEYWQKNPQLFKVSNFVKWQENRSDIPVSGFILTKVLANFFIPEPFRYGIEYLNNKEKLWLTDCLHGKRLKDLKGLPLKITNRGIHIFNTILSDYPALAEEIKNRNFPGVIFYFFAAELIRLGAGVNVIMRIPRNYVLHGRISMDKWLIYYDTLVRIKFPENLIHEVIDYIHAMFVYENQEVNLSGATVRSIQERVYEFHMIRRTKHYRKYQNIKFHNLNLKDFKEEKQDRTYTIEQLLSYKELYSESQVMHHCVHSYVEKCINGSSHIFSLVEKSSAEEKERRLITIELNGNLEIVQAKGSYNRLPNLLEKKLIEEWLKTNELKKSFYLFW